MPVTAGEPVQQIGHQQRHPTGRWGHMQQLVAAIDANAALAPATGLVDQPLHQQAVGLEQMIQLGRLPVGHRLIGGKGIAHLLDLLGQPQHPFAIEHGGDLLQRQGVVLDGQ